MSNPLTSGVDTRKHKLSLVLSDLSNISNLFSHTKISPLEHLIHPDLVPHPVSSLPLSLVLDLGWTGWTVGQNQWGRDSRASNPVPRGSVKVGSETVHPIFAACDFRLSPTKDVGQNLAYSISFCTPAILMHEAKAIFHDFCKSYIFLPFQKFLDRCFPWILNTSRFLEFLS